MVYEVDVEEVIDENLQEILIENAQEDLIWDIGAGYASTPRMSDEWEVEYE